jgi:hypothetical protein
MHQHHYHHNQLHPYSLATTTYCPEALVAAVNRQPELIVAEIPLAIAQTPPSVATLCPSAPTATASRELAPTPPAIASPIATLYPPITLTIAEVEKKGCKEGVT